MAGNEAGEFRRGSVTRRTFLGTSAIAGAAIAAASWPLGDATAATLTTSGRVAQPGIMTPRQRHLAFAAFDVVASTKARLVVILRQWAAKVETLLASDATHLTVTVGFGPTLFDNRFGLSGRQPTALQPLPGFAGDQLVDARCGGDIGIQVCSDDPHVVFRVTHQLARIAGAGVHLRWLQLGSLPRTRQGVTPRNITGFKDGTVNFREGDTADLQQFVWVQPGDGPGWLVGGTYLVTRRIEFALTAWDGTEQSQRERIIGRFEATGAPLTGKHEFDPPLFNARNLHNWPVIPPWAHIRLASPDYNGGARIQRRSYSFTESVDGNHVAGLHFACFQRDPRSGFIRIQQRLADGDDALNGFVTPTGSAIFAVPPAPPAGGYWGQELLGR